MNYFLKNFELGQDNYKASIYFNVFNRVCEITDLLINLSCKWSEARFKSSKIVIEFLFNGVSY